MYDYDKAKERVKNWARDENMIELEENMIVIEENMIVLEKNMIELG